MAINSIGASGLAAFQAANARLQSAAGLIANGPSVGLSATNSLGVQAVNTGATDNITTGLVELASAEQQAVAAARILQTENEVVGTLLDTFV